MKSEVVTYPVSTPWGKFKVAVSKKGIVSIAFPGQVLRFHSDNSKQFSKTAKLVEMELVRYLKGGKENWKKIPIDQSHATPRQKQMFKALSRIPAGEVRTYEWLAKKCGIPKGPRAMGGVLGSNPIPIICPCHRIVRKDGSLGGFSAGLAWKKKLLIHEGSFAQRFAKG